MLGAGGKASIASTYGRAPRNVSTYSGAENAAASGAGAHHGGAGRLTGRRSPGLGPCIGAGAAKVPRGSGAPRLGAALHDITNVAGSWAASQGLGKPGKQQASSISAPAQVPPACAPAARPGFSVPPRAGGDPSLATTAGGAPLVAWMDPIVVPEDDAPCAGEAANVQCLSEYAPVIMEQLFHDEWSFLPRPNYMESQSDINVKMRAILIDWLVEVHMKYGLVPETLFLCVNLVDRHLSRMPVMRKRLQLVGVVAMFIAAKFEEIHPPELNDFVYITDNAYTKDDILSMECTMLTTLSFQVVVPTAVHFVDILQRASGCDALGKEVMQYVLELALLDVRMLHHAPSQLAAAALLLSNELLDRQPVWPDAVARQSRHEEFVLRPCATNMRSLVVSAQGSTLQALQKKFALPQHHEVSRMRFPCR